MTKQRSPHAKNRLSGFHLHECFGISRKLCSTVGVWWGVYNLLHGLIHNKEEKDQLANKKLSCYKLKPRKFFCY